MYEEYYKNIEEIWKDIIDYKNLYQVSDFGRIKSLKFGKERILKPGKYDEYGHLNVNLWRNGNKQFFAVHVLVAEAFIGPCPDGMEICHNDGNPDNNRKANLRYDTPKNNNKDKIKHGTLLYGQKCLWAKVNNKQAIEIRKLTEEGKFTQKQIGEMYNIDQSTVSNIKTGKRWKHLDE